MKALSLGHFTADERHIRDLGWRLFLGGEMISLENEMANWNYYQNLSVSCSLSLALNELREDLHLDPASHLSWHIAARSTGCPLIIAGPSYPAEQGLQDVRIDIPGDSVRGTIRLELALTVCEGVANPDDQFAPHKPGHLVFSAEHNLRLEEEGSQVPILPVSFAEQGVRGSTGSLWWLNVVNRDLEAPVDSALWLWLNSDNPIIQGVLHSPDDDVNRAWSEFIGIDFSRQLLREALFSEDLSLEKQYPEGSLGETLASVVRLIDDSIEKVRAAYHENAGQVEAQLQSLTSGRTEHNG